MKRNYLFLMSITLLMLLSPSVKADVYAIGNDTIHFFNGNYYYIGNNDTVLADTSVITIDFVNPISNSSRSTFESNHNLVLIEALSSGNYQYKAPDGQNFVVLCNSLSNDPSVDHLITHFFMKLCDFEPNDNDIAEQWYLKNIGVYDESTLDGVWNITKGNSNVIVAVLDAGLDWDAEEFGPVNTSSDVVYHNLGEDEWNNWYNPETGNSIDDDANELVDDLKGWDYIHINQLPGGSNQYLTDNDVRPNHSEFWHGNAVTGIIAAKTNNDYGIAGIAGGDIQNNKNGIRILPLKIADWVNDWGVLVEYLSTADVEKAICYATDMGARVINMSFGCYYNPKLNLEAEVDYAYNNGVTLVAAAGNSGYSNSILYPAIMEKVIAVGATDIYDEHASFSNRGEEIEISAPGEDIFVLEQYGGNTGSYDGTSFSTPMVSATVGLMLSVNPYLTNGSIDEDGSIRNILKRTADKTGSYSYDNNGWNNRLGYGRLNTYAAVCMAIDYLPNLVVENSGTWSDRVISQKDIIVKEGVELTITGEVLMGKDAK
ncbi:MAG: S8 family serine peptidase, partial [Bacteroidetes bacterium]|nr:S8 family serine peptidase [Bacteroidota bacterium]